MSTFVFQVIGLALLMVGLIAGDATLQRRAPLSGAARQARILAVMAGVGGLVGAAAWWQNLPFAFSWALPPLAARLLAVAGIAFGVTALRAAWTGTTGHLRLIAVLLAVYLGPLAVAAVTLHLDRFDFAAPVTYVFFAIVLGMLAAALTACFRLAGDRRGLSFGRLKLVGTLAGLWGLVLFLWPAGPLQPLWPWPKDPLTTRLIAAMFLTVAAACLYAKGPAERRTVDMLCLIYGFGVVTVLTLAILAGKPALWAYLAFWAVVALQSATALLSDRATWPIPAPSRRG